MTDQKRSAKARPMVFSSWRDFTPMNTSVGNMLHNLTGSWRFVKPLYEDKVPACQNACPAGNDIEGWIRRLQKGDAAGAWRHLKREEPFPAILGRVCFSFCENACNRSPFDHHVGIRELERYLGDHAPAEDMRPDMADAHGTALAVIGSGPAGMSAAYYAGLLGFRVTMFEALAEPGGLLRVGIPAYRLPRDIVDAAFDELAALGVTVRTGVRVGTDVTLDELREDADFIFVATGCHRSIPLPVPGADATDRVLSGLALLNRIASGQSVDLGRSVAVIGGGNTAIDAARCAIRLGADVTVVYRRSEAEMPAHPQEIAEAREEGVRFRFLAAPAKIVVRADGSVDKMVCHEMQLGEPDSGGRRRPVVKPDATFELAADTVVTAIGEVPEMDETTGVVIRTGPDRIPVDGLLRAQTLSPGGPVVFAGGDVTDTARTVIHAVAAGKRAAIAMDCLRRGADVHQVMAAIGVGNGDGVSFSRYRRWNENSGPRRDDRQVVDAEKIVYDYFEKTPPVETVPLPPEQRTSGFIPYRSTYTPDEAAREAARCMHCGRCTECDNCLVFCPDLSVLKAGGDGSGYTIDYDYCKGCGICFTECPRHAMSMVEEDVSLADPPP